ncbi:uncharacterized protein [Watersipora subatra]|uniref:uncharacterized protein n=1 Tax=Watersipora subatra TaxID=2589382 RepID=UPI00355BCA78
MQRRSFRILASQKMKCLAVFTVLFFPLLSVHGIQTFDMCATFQLATDEKSLRLVTPGFLEGKNYPNSSECECVVEERQVSGVNLALNITVESLDLEVCNDANPFDTITISAVYQFEIFMKNFVICGDQLPISDLRPLASASGRYGNENTIYSMGLLEVDFRSDSQVEERGAQLLVESASGIRIQCQGVSGPLVFPPTSTASPPVSKSSSSPTVFPRERNEKNKRKKQSITIGAVVGTIIILFAIGLAVLVFFLIRKHQANNPGSIWNKARGKGDANNKSRRPSDGRPIYRDPNEGQPSLPMPSSVRMESEDQYLYMPGGQTTPVYANPQPIIYTNQDMMANSATEEQYQYGYIIPGNVNPSEENIPLVRVPPRPNKAPIPQPKSSQSVGLASIQQQLKESPQSLHSSTDSFPGPRQEGGLENSKDDDLVCEPALVKPSDMKKQKGLLGKQNVRFGQQPIKPKPLIKIKPQVPTPPPPPKKSLSVTGENGDTYQVVGVETTSDS